VDLAKVREGAKIRFVARRQHLERDILHQCCPKKVGALRRNCLIEKK
jgi:hypothetical protein